MQTRRLTIPLLVTSLAAVLAQGSCDVLDTQPRDNGVVSDLTIALGSHTDHDQEVCRSVVRAVILIAGSDTLGDNEDAELDRNVTFTNIKLNKGRSVLGVVVLSRKDSLLYGDSAPVEIVDNFSITLEVEPVAPVMQVCLPEGEQTIRIRNRGTDSVRWTIDTVPSGQLCAGPESPNCVDIDTSGTTDSTTPTTLEYRVHSDSLQRSFELIISSAEGDISEIEIKPRPVGNEPKARGRNPNGIPNQWVAWFERG